MQIITRSYCNLHDRTGRLEIFLDIHFGHYILHDRTGRLEMNTADFVDAIILHDRTGRLETYF